MSPRLPQNAADRARRAPERRPRSAGVWPIRRSSQNDIASRLQRESRRQQNPTPPDSLVRGRALSSRQTQYVGKDLEIGQPINSDKCSEAADGVARESEGVKSCPRAGCGRSACPGAVARPQERKFLGFSFTAGPGIKRTIVPKSLERFKQRIREITRKAKGVSIKTT